MNTTYQESKVSVYTSSNTVGTKNSNYTLLVDSDTGAPRVLTFLGVDRLFGSHYDKYIITYNTFTNDPPEPQTFEVPSGKANLYMQLMHILSVLYSHFYSLFQWILVGHSRVLVLVDPWLTVPFLNSLVQRALQSARQHMSITTSISSRKNMARIIKPREKSCLESNTFTIILG